jgi:predicted dehydrogenase
MEPTKDTGLSRRDLLKDAGLVAAATTVAGITAPFVHAAGSDTIQIALVGCGGRGTGAAINALSSKQGPTKLVAMADAFQDRMNHSVKALGKAKAAQFDVPAERQFIGFDAYKRAMDCLKPGDVVIMATPPAFRWVHFGYAIEKGLNVFMEKPITVDGPSTKKMLKLGEDAEKKGLKVGVGLMCRHCEARGELSDRIKNGELGDLTMLRAYRVTGPVGYFASGPKPSNMTDLEYQVRRFHSFLWASGGCFSDFLIHNIDECCWMKDAWPVSAKAYGGRHYRGDNIDQNFDVYSVEYTFADGAKLFLEGRNMDGCDQEFASYAHGTKGSAVVSESGHHPAHCRIYKGQYMSPSAKPVWEFNRPEPDPYQLEWEHLMAAIRKGAPYNEVKRGAEASLITSMGRMAAHTGRVITRDQIFNCEHEFAPTVATLALDGPAPLLADKDGKYPVPMPGKKTKREF